MPDYDFRILAALMASAVLEEILFRLGVHETLLRRPKLRTTPLVKLTAANLMTAALIAVTHGVFRSWLLGCAVLPIALAIGVLYERYRRVWPCIAVHALMNLIWFLAGPNLLAIISS